MVTRTKKIFVGGLSANTVVEDVKQYFEQFGKVSSAQVNTTELFFLPFKVCFEKQKCIEDWAQRRAKFLPFHVISQGLWDSFSVCCWCVQHCQHCLLPLKKKSITGRWICVCSGRIWPLAEWLHSCLLHKISLLLAPIPVAKRAERRIGELINLWKCLKEPREKQE